MFENFSNFFTLKAPVSRTSNADETDVVKTKNALKATGHYKTPDYGVTPWPDVAMFEGLESFQKQNGLKVDGEMKPSGPTAMALGGALAGKGERQNRPKRITPSSETARPATSRPKKPRPTPTPPKIKPVEGAASWWRSNQAPKATGADVSDNARAVAALMNTAQNVEHPRWIADAIASGDKIAVAKLGDWLQQLETYDPARAKSYNDDVMKRLTADKVNMISAMSAADKTPTGESQKGRDPSSAPGRKPESAASKNNGGKSPDPIEEDNKTGNSKSIEDVAPHKKESQSVESIKAQNDEYLNRVRSGDMLSVVNEIAKTGPSEEDIEQLPREVRSAYVAYWMKKRSSLGFHLNMSKQEERRRHHHAVQAGKNSAASWFDYKALGEPAKRAWLDFEEGVTGLLSKPLTVDEYKAKVKAIESQVPRAYRNTAEFHNMRGHAETVGVAVDIATSLLGKKAIQVGMAGASAIKKAGMVSNTLAEAGFSRQAQQAGAALAAATLGGGPVLNILQKGGIATLDKEFPKITRALRDMTPAQGEALAGALNDVGIDLGVDAFVDRAVKIESSKRK